MQIVDLLATFSNPDTIDSLSASQRLMAGLVTTLLGMGITFLALVVLMFVTSLMEKIGGKEKAPVPAPRARKTSQSSGGKTDVNRRGSNDEEIAAAITTALAVMLETSTSNFVVKTIRRVEDSSTSWSRAGLADQLQRKF
jgi:sodium pump decarboxylase gamma subunit